MQVLAIFALKKFLQCKCSFPIDFHYNERFHWTKKNLPMDKMKKFLEEDFQVMAWSVE